MITRSLYAMADQKFFKNKAIIIVGPRQVGKTTLLKWLTEKYKDTVLLLDGDEADIRTILKGTTSTALRRLIGPAKVVLIDEAQQIHGIGTTIKLIVDKIPDVQVVATGSSSFELANEVNEALTGRKYEFLMLPLSLEEMVSFHGELDERRLLNARLIYGSYPEIILHPGEEKERLKQLVNSYLFKDVFSFRELRRPELIQKLVEAIALQVGSEVSFNELSRIIGADPVTIERYVTLLERSFVLFRLRSFSRNARNELKKSRKIYFYDNGVRNALIANFAPVKMRSDIGALWENYLVSERAKRLSYREATAHPYFWRTAQQQEIDYIEESDGVLHAVEFKWNPKAKAALPKTFKDAYPSSDFTVVTPENYIDWLCGN